MIEITKRLQKSLDRIHRCGGVVLIHHTSEESVDYQLQNGGGAFSQCGFQAPRRWRPDLRQGRSIRRGRTNPASGARMSKFADDLTARILIINRMIPNANKTERRKLQKERSDLEAKLSKVTA